MTRISLVSLVAAGALLCGCTSMGWHTYAQAPRSQQVAANGANAALICRDVAPTGSRLVKRECHTQAEWDTLADGEMQKLNQDAARSMPATGR